MSTVVKYGEDLEIKPGRQIVHRSELSFDATLSTLEAAIAAEDLWVVNRIDPQMMLSKAGYEIRPARQIFYFHPRLMVRLLATNPAAVVEVPLKFVALVGADSCVTVRHPDIEAAFASYEGMSGFAAELAEVTRRIAARLARPGAPVITAVSSPQP